MGSLRLSLIPASDGLLLSAAIDLPALRAANATVHHGLAKQVKIIKAYVHCPTFRSLMHLLPFY